MKEFLKSMFSDGQDVSSKRVNGTICILFGLLIDLIATCYFAKIGVLQDHLYIVLGTPIMTGLAFFGITTLSEGFFK